MDEPLLGGGGRARAGTWSGGGPTPPPGPTPLSRSPEASSTGRRSEDSLALSLDCITEDEITFSGGGRGARDLRGVGRGKSPPTAGKGTSPWLYARPRADSMRFDNISLDPWLQKFHQQEAAAAGGEEQLLGTFAGVFLPCCQNIMGIILFIRLSWIVGEAGVMRTLGIVGICCCATFLTTLSLAAIATNGEFKGGGPYFLISRNLGAEVGVGVGLCFYLATTTASSMYILGAVETVLDSAPGLRVFTPADARAPTLHDYQLYGSVLLLLASLLVLAGMKRLSKIAPLFFVPVVVSILLIFVGIGLARPSGEGITGLRAGTWADNWAFTPHYLPTDENGFPSADGKVAWSFGALAGLFFPSVTGIMAGSNRSASLKDPQGSIPRGTISAHLLTTAIYVTAVSDPPRPLPSLVPHGFAPLGGPMPA